MSKNINSVLKDVLRKISPSTEEMGELTGKIEVFLIELRNILKNANVDAEVFVGGSFAKETVIKKDHYDVDIFLRFEKSENMLGIDGVLTKIPNCVIVHGSRDYYRVNLGKELYAEVVPVLKVSKPEKADNITDLSYFHVNYIKKKIKDKKILDEIKLAKAFCHATNCYGAESYVRGFSGYGIEL